MSRKSQQQSPGKLKLNGELTIYTATDRKAELINTLQADKIDLDLSAVSEMDSAGLQLLLLLKREADKAGKHLAISASNSVVQEAFDICNVHYLFEAHP